MTELDVREEAISWERLQHEEFGFAQVTPAYVESYLDHGQQYVAFILYDDDKPVALVYAWNIDRLGDIQLGMLVEVTCYEGISDEYEEQLLSWLESKFVLAFMDDYTDFSFERGYIYPRPSEVEGYVFVREESARPADLVEYLINERTLKFFGLEDYMEPYVDFLLAALSPEVDSEQAP